ncbi:thioredoxin family protein [Haloplanus salilacus]|uniref:thioredoxin family protein n=1 Tax=Haloplanus salilacus TaxID=2949994 RepID=UPI0030D4B7BC
MSDSNADADPQPDPEAALDDLIDAGLVDERSDGTLVATEEFESTRRIYRDTYADADETVVVETVTDLFDVDEATAEARLESGEVTREELIAFLSLRSLLDDVGDGRLAVMAALAAQISTGSPVPEEIEELDEGEWEPFFDDASDAVITVWRHDCAPCEALKGDLDEIFAALPDHVAVAGVDGEAVPDFRRTFDVDSAPAVCCFRDSYLVETITGRKSPADYADRFDDVY